MSDYEDDEDPFELGRLPGGGRNEPRISSRAADRGISFGAGRIGSVTIHNGPPDGSPSERPRTPPRWAGPRPLVAVAVGAVALVLVAAMVMALRAFVAPTGGHQGPPTPVSVVPVGTNPATVTPTAGAPVPPPPSPSPEPPSPSPSASPSPSEVPVRWKGNVTLVYPDNGPGQLSWDLDVNPPSVGLPYDLSLDCYLVCTPGRIDGNAVLAWTGSAPPSRADCAKLLNANLGRTYVEIKEGSTACFGTRQGRVGYFTTGTAPDQDSVLLTVTLWERA